MISYTLLTTKKNLIKFLVLRDGGIKMSKNQYYEAGYKFGFECGPSPRLGRLIGRNPGSVALDRMSLSEMVTEIVGSYNDFNEIPPEFFLDDLSIKEVNFFLLGYVDGKNKNVRNRADKKYHEKIGLVSKSYKLHEEVVTAFSKACEERGVSLGPTLEKLMMQFISEETPEP